jgi:hypothetical protein
MLSADPSLVNVLGTRCCVGLVPDVLMCLQPSASASASVNSGKLFKALKGGHAVYLTQCQGVAAAVL